MSTENIIKPAEAGACCASCGVAESDEIKLKECDKCDLAQYCSEKCQQEHRQTHEAICKERSAELREELLFRQPESSHLGDCPICFLPMPLDTNQSVKYTCCSKTICDGCDFANDIREEEEGIKLKCPFCRKEVPKNDEESRINYTKRAEAGDPDAISRMGKIYFGKGDYEKALEYLTKAAALGDAEAHFSLSNIYREEEGVEKDKKREVYHLEEASIAGHPDARYNLGCDEEEKGGLIEQ